MVMGFILLFSPKILTTSVIGLSSWFGFQQGFYRHIPNVSFGKEIWPHLVGCLFIMQSIVFIAVYVWKLELLYRTLIVCRIPLILHFLKGLIEDWQMSSRNLVFSQNSIALVVLFVVELTWIVLFYSILSFRNQVSVRKITRSAYPPLSMSYHVMMYFLLMGEGVSCLLFPKPFLHYLNQDKVPIGDESFFWLRLYGACQLSALLLWHYSNKKGVTFIMYIYAIFSRALWVLALVVSLLLSPKLLVPNRVLFMLILYGNVGIFWALVELIFKSKNSVSSTTLFAKRD